MILTLIGLGLIGGVLFARRGLLGDYLLAVAIAAALLVVLLTIDHFVRSLLHI